MTVLKILTGERLTSWRGEVEIETVTKHKIHTSSIEDLNPWPADDKCCVPIGLGYAAYSYILYFIKSSGVYALISMITSSVFVGTGAGDTSIPKSETLVLVIK